MNHDTYIKENQVPFRKLVDYSRKKKQIYAKTKYASETQTQPPSSEITMQTTTHIPNHLNAIGECSRARTAYTSVISEGFFPSKGCV